MQRRLDLPLMLATGAGLVVARPPWDGTLEDRVVGAGWLAAVALWAWLAVVGAVHTWATRTGRARVSRLSGSLLPGAVRRRIEQLALAGLLVVPVACADDGADAAAPVLVLEETLPVGPATTTGTGPSVTFDEGATATTVAPDAAERNTTTTTVGPVPAEPAPAAPGPTHAAGDDPDRADPVDDRAFVVPVEPGTRVVLRGDNLWSIAAEQVAATTGTTPDPVEIHRYWSALIEANRGILVSGDPDVIYPGEVLRLPAHQP